MNRFLTTDEVRLVAVEPIHRPNLTPGDIERVRARPAAEDRPLDGPRHREDSE